MFNILNTDSGDPFHVFALQCNILYVFYLGSSMEVLVGEITAHEALTMVGHVMQLPKKCYWTQFFILFLSLLEINLFINLGVALLMAVKKRWLGQVILFCLGFL